VDIRAAQKSTKGNATLKALTGRISSSRGHFALGDPLKAALGELVSACQQKRRGTLISCATRFGMKQAKSNLQTFARSANATISFATKARQLLSSRLVPTKTKSSHLFLNSAISLLFFRPSCTENSFAKIIFETIAALAALTVVSAGQFDPRSLAVTSQLPNGVELGVTVNAPLATVDIPVAEGMCTVGLGFRVRVRVRVNQNPNPNPNSC